MKCSQKNKTIWMQNHVIISMFFMSHNVFWFQIENHEFEIFESKYVFDFRFYLHDMKFAKKSNQFWYKTTFFFFLFFARNWFFYSFFYFKSKSTNSKSLNRCIFRFFVNSIKYRVSKFLRSKTMHSNFFFHFVFLSHVFCFWCCCIRSKKF